MVGSEGTSSSGSPHNLFAGLARCIGRELERATLADLLTAYPLVTLTGSGGVGKTRLALAVAQDHLAVFPQGVWLIELAPLADSALVAAAVARALGVSEEAGRPLLDTLVTVLREQRLLLVLDNCEHVLAACAALLDALLVACAGLKVLATSRRQLRSPHEQRFPVPPLGLPPAGQSPGLEAVARSPAVALFVERARAVDPTFTLDAANAPVVAAVCAQLDGLPLAIELAAARVRTHAPAVLLADLGDRLRVLVGGRRGLPARQRTVHGMLDWSYTLLDVGERALFPRLSVFAGGWTAQAAQAVCVLDHDLPFTAEEGLASLVEQSLVFQESVSGRYGMLETVREYAAYALERLAAAADAGAVRTQHARHFLALAEEAEPRLTGPEQGAWLARLEAEHDNLRAALGWMGASGAVEDRLRLAGALWRFWLMHGYLSEGRGWLEATLAGGGGQSPVRAQALTAAGSLVNSQGEHGRAEALYEESLALRRKLGDRRGIAATLSNLGLVAYGRGEYGRAESLLEEALALRRELGDRRGIATALNNLGLVAARRGEYVWAEALQQEVLGLVRELGDRQGIATALGNLGETAYAQGEHGRAEDLHGEALALFRELGDRDGAAFALSSLGLVAERRGEHARAEALQEEALALFREVGNREGTAYALGALGNVASGRREHRRAAALQEDSLRLGRDIGAPDVLAGALEGLAQTAGALDQPQRAARLGGAAAALRETLGVPLAPVALAGHERAVQGLRAALGEEAFAAAWAAGRLLTLDQAIALALEDHETAP